MSLKMLTVFAAVSAAVACSDTGSGDPAQSDGDDTATDSDADTDADTDSDADGDSDADADSDTVPEELLGEWFVIDEDGDRGSHAVLEVYGYELPGFGQVSPLRESWDTSYPVPFVNPTYGDEGEFTSANEAWVILGGELYFSLEK